MNLVLRALWLLLLISPGDCGTSQILAKPPKQPEISLPITDDQIKCLSSANHNKQMTCPPHSTNDNRKMESFMQDCLQMEDRGSLVGARCYFYPDAMQDGKMTSCHLLRKTKYPCSYGFRLLPTIQKRKGNADDAFIGVEFYGKVPPIPIKSWEQTDTSPPIPAENGNSPTPYYRAANYLALGFSTDDEMGNDVVIYCHPYMDDNVSNRTGSRKNRYPDKIGLAVNDPTEYAAYDAARDEPKKAGGIRKENVTFYDFGFVQDGTTQPKWSVIACRAEISTHVLLRSKYKSNVGVEMDFERTDDWKIFLGMGHCLQKECLGAVKENDEIETRRTAKRTSILEKHFKVYRNKNNHFKLYYPIRSLAGRKRASAWGIGALIVFSLLYF